MKRFLAKIWVPALLVMLAAAQSFGIDASRAVGLRRLTDSLILTVINDSTGRDSLAADSLKTDSLILDTVAADTTVIAARDTIVIPDSLQYTDPFFFKYYIAVKDSVTRAEVRDSLIQAGDTLELKKLDSLYVKDSTEVAQAKHAAWYASLSRKERKKYDAKQALPGLIAEANRKLAIKDSIRAHKDSIIEATPRILETFAIPDSMHYKRIITWKHDREFHNISELREQKTDTSFNYNFYDYPFMKNDVNATWLGVSGSPVETFNYFKRTEEEDVVFYTPFQTWNYTPATLPKFNTKTPYTELAYWGTLFANKEKEESNVRVLTTQNITPALNLTLEYRRYGGNGMLRREDNDNRSFVAATNYLGKKYLMHAGFIYNKVERSENGGLIDLDMIRDTTVDAREIEVRLKDASTMMKKNTVFLDQSYRIPFTFLDKEVRAAKKAEMEKQAYRDSIFASGDSLAIEELQAQIEDELAAAAEQQDTTLINTDVTTAFIGHSSEFSVFRKTYTDAIGASDAAARAFYHDRFYLNPAKSRDSLRVMRIENKAFIRLQPWKDDGIVSKLDVGIGDKLLSYYTFRPEDYITGSGNVLLNSVYLYAGANGQYKKYFTWNATGGYTFAGHEVNDFNINANMAFNLYPFRKDRQSPLAFKVHFETSLKEPDYYDQHLCTNHYRWNNSFGKISTTKLEASLAIPRWDMDASFGYALLSNNIYYDAEGIVRQNTSPMSVMSATLRKNFQIWKFHLDHQALFQLSSDQSVMPLPMLALNLRYYFQFDVVKNVMKMQIGANGTFTTKWYAQAYNPVLGVFFNQNERKYGNCPYIDAFVNVQWKRVSIFVKAVNVNMGWPNKRADYFTADGYINTQRAIKFGISWPFWTFPGKKGSTGASGQGVAGGGMESSGRSGGAMSPGGMQRATNIRR